MKGYNKTPPDYAKLAKPKAAPAKKATGGLGSLMGNASDYMAASSPKAAPQAAVRPAAKAAPKAAPLAASKPAGYSAETKAWAASERAGIAAQRAKKPAAAKPKAKSNRGYDSYKKLMDY